MKGRLGLRKSSGWRRPEKDDGLDPYSTSPGTASKGNDSKAGRSYTCDRHHTPKASLQDARGCTSRRLARRRSSGAACAPVLPLMLERDSKLSSRNLGAPRCFSLTAVRGRHPNKKKTNRDMVAVDAAVNRGGAKWRNRRAAGELSMSAPCHPGCTWTRHYCVLLPHARSPRSPRPSRA